MTWWAEGLLIENCNCQAVCPGHVHFDQYCTHERCRGWWAIQFDSGDFEGLSLGGTAAVVAYDTPQHMIDGNWIEVVLIDEAASEGQRSAIEAILTGKVGGPWEVLSRFVGTRLPTRVLPIRILEEERSKRIVVGDVLDGAVSWIRGRDRAAPVTFENMFNQIHASTMVVGRGSSRYDDGQIVIATEGTHGLWSHFRWAVA